MSTIESESMIEVEKNSEMNTFVLTETGLGFGSGAISVETRIASGELARKSVEAAVDIICHSTEVFVTVDNEAKDDGCGDGRETELIYLLDPDTGEIQTFNRSLNRAKVFGGGLVVAGSMWRAVEGARAGTTLSSDREFISDQLTDRGIAFGAHTDTHAEGEKSGCGAIDRYDEISGNISVFRDEIIASLETLYGETFDENSGAILAVLDNYDELNDYHDMTGAETMAFIEKKHSVIKKLKGDHNECLVVLNTVEGTTLDQKALKKQLENRQIDEDVQSFAVDVWRGEMYAREVSDVASEHGYDKNESYKKAYADFLIRTLATSGTLTAGDQPVIMRDGS